MALNFLLFGNGWLPVLPVVMAAGTIVPALWYGTLGVLCVANPDARIIEGFACSSGEVTGKSTL
jgi:hypothetical protein